MAVETVIRRCLHFRVLEYKCHHAKGALAAVSGGSENVVSGGYNHNATGDLDWRAGTLFENQ
jgi:hypothetical protein